jgi:hypothetical protein
LNPWLLLSLVGTGIYLVASSSANTWPPSPSVQQGLVNQLAANAQQRTGQTLSAAQVQQIQSAVNSAPSAYLATLPQGTTPTVAGYQAWVLQQGNAAISGGTSLWGQAQQGYGQLQQQATASGPLGYGCASPYPIFDVWGNALFVNDDGSPWIVKGPHWDYAGDFYGD